MKMQPGAYRAALSVLVAAILGGCSGGATGSLPTIGSSGPAVTQATGKHPGKQKVSMRMLIPRAPRHAHGRQLRPFFVATSTAGVEIQVYAHGSHVTPLATTTVGVGPSSPLCHAVTGGRSCQVNAEAPVGDDDFVVTSYDAAPVGGSFASAKQLAIGTTTFTVVKGTLNQILLTLGGVVSKGVVVLASASVPVIDHDSQTVTVGAQDADGNAIVADGWFDASGNPVTMTLSASNTSPVTIGLAPTNMTFAAHTSTLTYDSSTATSAQVLNGFTSTISATPNTGTVGSAVLTLAAPTFTEYPISSMSSQPTGIIAGPDNAMWFTESASDKIGRVATNAAAGANPSEYALTSSANPKWLTLGSDGKIWYTEFGRSKIGSIDPTTKAVVDSYSTPSMNSLPFGIVAGPDNQIWFSEQCSSVSKIVSFNPSTPNTMTEHSPMSMSSGPNQIAVGPDGNLWFEEGFASKIGVMSTAGVALHEYAANMNMGDEGGIAAGSDGAVWFSECNNSANDIGRLTTGGAYTPYAVTTNPANPTGITSGPDGALWFAEQTTNTGATKIGRIDPVTHVIDEFSIPTSGADPYGITKGPDGAIWFTETDGNKIGKLQ